MALTAEQISIVKSTAPILREHGKTVTSLMYSNMLKGNPELKNIFSLRAQHTGAQPAALAGSVLAYAEHIDDLGALGAIVERIAMKHVSLFIRPDMYDIVAKNLIGAFGEVLGDSFTPEIKDAWIAAYMQLADIFIQRESVLYGAEGEWQNWRKFTIAKKEAESDTVTSFYLKPSDGKPLARYLPGQYTSLQIPLPQLDGLNQSRQFSLSEAPGNPEYYRVSVKREYTIDNWAVEDLASGKIPGVVSNTLHDKFSVGDEVELSPPHGDFFYDSNAIPKDAPLVLLSAGVGATPLMSILQSVLPSSDSSRPISWVHGARNSRSVLYKTYIRDAASKHNNLNVRILMKEVGDTDKLGEDYDVQARPEMATLEQEAAVHLENPKAQYYICGPHPWMLQTKDWLLGKGVPEERLHLEVFETGGL